MSREEEGVRIWRGNQDSKGSALSARGDKRSLGTIAKTGPSLPHTKEQARVLAGRLSTSVAGAVDTGVFSKSKYST